MSCNSVLVQHVSRWRQLQCTDQYAELCHQTTSSSQNQHTITNSMEVLQDATTKILLFCQWVYMEWIFYVSSFLGMHIPDFVHTHLTVCNVTVLCSPDFSYASNSWCLSNHVIVTCVCPSRSWPPYDLLVWSWWLRGHQPLGSGHSRNHPRWRSEKLSSPST